MKLPDKIFITEYNASVRTGYFSHDKDDIFNQEYIRKEAILEWANNWEKIGVSDDFAYAIQTLIKHIESL